MILRSILGTLSCACLVAGCAIRPLPDDVTGYSTAAIVAQIRCEAREAVSAAVIDLLLNNDNPNQKQREKTQALGRELAALSRPDRYKRYREIDKAGYLSIDPETRKNFPKYDGAAIAYDFTFDIKENNTSAFDAGFTDPFSNGVLNIGVVASNTRSRNNSRNFRMSDTFRDLLVKVTNEYCAGDLPGKNWQYPIVGSIGLAEVVQTFIELNEAGRLESKEKEKVPTLADTLEFETTILGSVNPVVTLNPVGRNVGRALRLGNAGFRETASRVDKHRVQVSISLPPDAPSKASTATEKGATRRGATPAETRALRELDRQDDRILSRKLDRLIDR